MSDEIRKRVQAKVEEMERIADKAGLYHRGYRFWPPYACFACGEPISAHQFAFSRICGSCDCGNSKTARLMGLNEIFVAGKVVLENENDKALIRPEFTPSHRRRHYPLRHPPKPQPRVPRPPRFPYSPRRTYLP